MNELTSTRHNEFIDPSLHLWGWEIAIYLFIGGLVAGIMIISGYFVLKGKYKNEKSVYSSLAPFAIVILSIGMFALLLDLEHKLYVWRLYLSFKIGSPMSWGAWILILVYPALFASMLLNAPAWIKKRQPDRCRKVNGFFDFNAKYVRLIAVVNIVLGISLGIYTGILLSGLGARPLWNSALLPFLFLTSGLSSGAAFVHLISKDHKESVLLEKADNYLLVLELLIIGLFIIGMLSAAQVQNEAIRILLNGPYAAFFWVFVVCLGLVIPLFVQSLVLAKKIAPTPVAAIFVLLGGLLLRFVIVFAGQYSHWQISDYIK